MHFKTQIPKFGNPVPSQAGRQGYLNIHSKTGRQLDEETEYVF